MFVLAPAEPASGSTVTFSTPRWINKPKADILLELLQLHDLTASSNQIFTSELGDSKEEWLALVKEIAVHPRVEEVVIIHRSPVRINSYFNVLYPQYSMNVDKTVRYFLFGEKKEDIKITSLMEKPKDIEEYADLLLFTTDFVDSREAINLKIMEAKTRLLLHLKDAECSRAKLAVYIRAWAVHFLLSKSEKEGSRQWEFLVTQLANHSILQEDEKRQILALIK